MNNTERTVYLTEEGLIKLQEELDYLIATRRPEVANQIAEAKAEGDLRENAGYDEAKNAQAFMEGRIRELKTKLKFAKIIDENDAPSDEVALGRTIVVREVGTSDEESYSLVGSSEADPANGRISNESPVGRAIMGRKVNDIVEVKSPGGVFKFKIVRID